MRSGESGCDRRTFGLSRQAREPAPSLCEALAHGLERSQRRGPRACCENVVRARSFLVARSGNLPRRALAPADSVGNLAFVIKLRAAR